ncbi:MAG: proline dehydrogenase family protein [Armatimonadota bacterium]|nr:proline dehydrogenase family protein [Armatimonadota bacterium]
MFLRRFFIALSVNARVQSFVLQNGLARRASRRFIAGESLEDGVEAVRSINRLGIHASLNYLGEKTTNVELAESAAAMYIRILEAIHTHKLDCNLSVKLSQLGLAIDESLAELLLRRILEAARHRNLFVRIDMEESPLVEPTLRIWRRMRSEGFSNVGVVIQAYLYRSAADVEALVKEGARIRLVKGAYLEPPSVAFPRKKDVDENYRRLMEFLLRFGDYPAIATHDEKLIAHAKSFAAQEGISPSRFEFQMIYGVRRDLQRALAQEGYNVRVYIPFGEQWYPYFMRRLAERPANVLFLLRNVLVERV